MTTNQPVSSTATFHRNEFQYMPDPFGGIPQDVPAYRVIGERGFFDGVQLHPDGAEITWEGEPNIDFEALNEMAARRMDAFREKLVKASEELSAQTGKKFNGQFLGVREATLLSSAAARRAVPLMGGNLKGLPRSNKRDTTPRANPINRGDSGDNTALRRGRPPKVQ